MGQPRAEDARAPAQYADSPLFKLRGGVLMPLTPSLTSRAWLAVPVAALLLLAGCQDAAGPALELNAHGAWNSPAPYTGLHILQQAPTAPALETYEVSFWARRDRASTVIVNYQPGEGESVGRPFLRFDIPRDGLTFSPDLQQLQRRDSVYITLTIDPQTLSVDFAPSGVAFSRRHPATLAIWYGNADPDLNGDGIVDAVDQACLEQLAIWGRPERPAPWLKTASQTEAGQQWIWAELFHFSEYAVSW